MDLGLPSGLKWAKCNLGANVPESDGLYLSWGNIEGHPTGEGYDFSIASYDASPAAAISSDLSLSQDAARANLSAPWRMPTSAEFKELYDNCTSEWTTLNGVNGRLFTSNVNGKTLFLPAAGFYIGTLLNSHESAGRYWSSTYDSAENAYNLSIGNLSVNPQDSSHRRYGFSVRAVLPGTPNRSIIPPTPEDEPKEEETPTVEELKYKDER